MSGSEGKETFADITSELPNTSLLFQTIQTCNLCIPSLQQLDAPGFEELPAHSNLWSTCHKASFPEKDDGRLLQKRPLGCIKHAFPSTSKMVELVVTRQKCHPCFTSKQGLWGSACWSESCPLPQEKYHSLPPNYILCTPSQIQMLALPLTMTQWGKRLFGTLVLT